MSDASILEVHGLCTYYGSSQVLFDVHLRAPRQGVVAILGRNGAGKTTLLKTIIGEVKPARGRVMFDGRNSTATPTEVRVRQGMGYLPQEQAVFDTLSVYENLLVGAMASKGKSRIDMVLTMFPKLGERLSQRAGTLSGGERKMLALGRALLSNPKLLLLDEPTEGVWLTVIEEIADRLEVLAKEVGVVLVEQHVELALGVSSYAYVLDRGCIVLEGPADKVRDDAKLFRYLTP